MDAVMTATPVSDRPDSSKQYRRLLLAILVLAAGLRFWALPHDLPFSYFGDELHLMNRSMALGTGDLNPHWFSKPAFLMYVLLFCYGLYFAIGLVTGRFESIDHFAAHYLTDSGPFLLIGRLVVALSSIALVYIVYRLGRRGLDSPKWGLIGALVVAVAPSLVNSSQRIKADIPCAMFVALSLFIFLRAKNESSLRGLILSALAAGAAMGTKYCGIVLIPAYVLWELVSTIRRRRTWKPTLVRVVAILGFFVLGFFLTSPYNFLDPSWSRAQLAKLRVASQLESTQESFDPDSKTIYRPGVYAWPAAGAFFFRKMLDASPGGPFLTVLFALGIVGGLREPRYRDYTLLVGLVFLGFLFVAVAIVPFHISSRHFSTLIPLLAPLAAVGVAWPLTFTPLAVKRRDLITVAVVALICIPALALSLEYNRNLLRIDSRTVAYEWIVSNLSPRDRILLEDEGPLLKPNPIASERLQDLLSQTPSGPFTLHQDRRLQLLLEFPPPDGMNFDRLGHPWWLTSEISQVELRESDFHQQIGNPLVARTAKTVEEYRQQGIRYVVTNSDAQTLMSKRPNAESSFPSFFSLYRALSATRLVREFDASNWDGKGPTIWIYDITE